MGINSWADLFRNNGSSNGFDINRSESRMEEILTNALVARQEFFRQFLDPRRDMERECGHFPLGSPIDPWVYYDLFCRDPIAARVVEIYPKESWQVLPWIFETEDKGETEFESGLKQLCKNLRGEKSYYHDDEMTLAPLMEELINLDIVAGINQYGVGFLAFDDVSSPEDYAEPVKSRRGMKLLHMRSFPEVLAPVTRWDTDISSPRYGYPEEYQLCLADPRQYSGTTLPPSITLKVHWSRVIHYADQSLFSKILGIPRQHQVLDRILDLRKLYGGSAEMYWRAAFYGLALQSNPALGGQVRINTEATKNMMENFWNSLDRTLYLTGMTADVLSPTVVDPSPQIDKHLEAICIKGGYPMRIFKGSERGELASNQDDAAWNDRLKQRELFNITPKQIIPLIDRLIEVGCLPKPAYQQGGTTLNNRRVRVKRWVSNAAMPPGMKGASVLDTRGDRTLVETEMDVVDVQTPQGYMIRWPDLTSQSSAEKAGVLLQRTQAWAQYSDTGMSTVVPPKVFATEFDSMEEDKAEAMLEESAKIIQDTTPPPDEMGVEEEGAGLEMGGAEGDAGTDQPPQLPGLVPGTPQLPNG